MTETENSTMRPDVEAERERLAAEAFERIRSGQHWRDWTYIAQGLDVGCNRAMRESYSNRPIGRGYNEAFGRWMDKHPWARKIDKATRNHLFWVADHLTQIEAWRDTLPVNQPKRKPSSGSAGPRKAAACSISVRTRPRTSRGFWSRPAHPRASRRSCRRPETS